MGIPILALILTFFIEKEPGINYLSKYFSSLIITAFYWNGSFMIFIYFRKKFPLIRQTPKRLVITICALVTFLLIGETFICRLFESKEFVEILNPKVLFGEMVYTFIATIIVGSIYENVYFFDQWKSTIQLNEELKNQQVRTQFEVLQNQMSPHFLFNSLNTLATLISEDQKIATEFTQKLSEVYRYILANKEKELVYLEEELEFARAYLYLLKMRFPENLFVEFSIDPIYLKQYIAPLTIQMLVENAVKHNIISKANPLYIEVYVDNGKSIVVKNNFQIKKVIEKSTKTGLANIRNRYKYFGNKEIDIITTAHNFLVAIPLINLVNEMGQPTTVEI